MIWRAIAAVAILGPKLFAQPAGPALPPAAEAVPLTQIAVRDEELRRILRDISQRLPSTSELDEFEQQLENREEAVRTSLAESDELLAGSATIIEIREHARQWRASGGPEARQRKILARWGTACEENMTALKKARGGLARHPDRHPTALRTGLRAGSGS